MWSLTREMRAIASGSIVFGPEGKDTRFVIAASWAFVSECLTQLNRARNLGQTAAIPTLRDEMAAAIRSHGGGPKA